MVSKAEVKSTMAGAIGGAFGFIIALIWRDVIIGIMQLVGIWQDSGFDTWGGAGFAIVGAIIITVIAVIGIVYISKWGGEKKE